jgi:hypothetical protein
MTCLYNRGALAGWKESFFGVLLRPNTFEARALRKGKVLFPGKVRFYRETLFASISPIEPASHRTKFPSINHSVL